MMMRFRFINPFRGDTIRYKKGVPKRDGSGRGIGANQGRGGCNPPMYRGRNSGRGQGRGRRRW